MAVPTLNDNALATLDELRQYLGLRGADQDSLLTSFLNRASEEIAQHCGRKFKLQKHRNQNLAVMEGRAYLQQYPVTHVESMHTGYTVESVEGTADSGTTTTLTDNLLMQAEGYWVDAEISVKRATLYYKRHVTAFSAASDTVTLDAALPTAVAAGDAYRLRLYNRSGFYKLLESDYAIEDADRGLVEFDAGWGNLVVNYFAGYETIPDDLKQACLRHAAWMHEMRLKPGVASQEAMGARSEFRGARFLPEVAEALQRYRKIGL